MKTDYEELCNLRNDVGLGCEGCVLSGHVECMWSFGRGTKAPTIAAHTYSGKDHGVDDYDCSMVLKEWLL
jgi:hypothetical protein